MKTWRQSAQGVTTVLTPASTTAFSIRAPASAASPRSPSCRRAPATAAVLEQADLEAGELEQPHLRAHRLPQALLERVLAASVEHDVDGLGGRIGEAEPVGPGVAVGRGLGALAGERRPRPLDQRAVRLRHAVHLHEVRAKLTQREDRLHVVAAHLAGHVAVAAQLALEGDVDDLVGDLAAAVHQAQRGDELAPGGVRVELAGLDARAALGEAVALHEVEGDPLAVAAAGAAHRVGAIVDEGHVRPPSDEHGRRGWALRSTACRGSGRRPGRRSP